MHDTEKTFADLLDKQKRKWVYHPCKFKLNNTTYEPDFYLPKEKLYIEVIASKGGYLQNKYKYDLFKKLYPKLRFKILDYAGYKYPNKRQINLFLGWSFRKKEIAEVLKLEKTRKEHRFTQADVYLMGLRHLAEMLRKAQNLVK